MQSVTVLTHHTFQQSLLLSETTSNNYFFLSSLPYLLEPHQSHVSGGGDGFERGGHLVLLTVPLLTFGPQLPGPRTSLQNCVNSTAEVWNWSRGGCGQKVM